MKFESSIEKIECYYKLEEIKKIEKELGIDVTVFFNALKRASEQNTDCFEISLKLFGKEWKLKNGKC